MTHCAIAVAKIAMPIFFMIENTAAKFTTPFPRRRSTASPVRIGTYSVSTTVTAASRSESPTSSQYFRI